LVLVRIDKITKNFGGLAALRKVSFDVSTGQIKSVIGPNGAGKTTLFNIISGLIRSDGGCIFFSGKDITGNVPEENARIGIARTFQVTKPFLSMTVVENVMIGALKGTSKVQNSRRKAVEILNFLGLEKIKDRFPGNLTVEDRKRLELARALALEPSLLLLDEVMAGLNASEVEGVKKVLRDLRNAGMTILLIEHVLHAVLSLSDEVVVLNYGEKIFEGGPKEVVKDRRVIEAYLGEDFV
jgi:branched-chain amino acid transport system ATP-binding protein